MLRETPLFSKQHGQFPTDHIDISHFFRLSLIIFTSAANEDLYWHLLPHTPTIPVFAVTWSVAT